jgi:prevent-host-death family protein
MWPPEEDMGEVGVKSLKDHLSAYLRRARDGERIVVTDRGAAVAVLGPVEEGGEARSAWELVRAGAASWAGGKPQGPADPPKVRGTAASDMVLEDRR